MPYILRGAREEDIKDIQILSAQFTLINLPNNTKELGAKIQRSIKSFSGEIENKKDAEYLFVVEDLESEKIVGSSLIIPKHGTPKAPHFYFKIKKKELFSKDLGVGFVHQVLKLEEETDGPTEIGGLLVDSEYRRLPEKIGKQISLVRFLYMGIYPNRFENKLLCELSPPQMSLGKSEFWEAFGRRFTGLSYQEADRMSRKHKEFIHTLFPKEEIYTSLLSSSARFVLGRVGEETKPAQQILETLGFRYLEEVDPFDGGPHYGAITSEVTAIKNVKSYAVKEGEGESFNEIGLIGSEKTEGFFALQSGYRIKDDGVLLPSITKKILSLDIGSKIFLTPMI